MRFSPVALALALASLVPTEVRIAEASLAPSLRPKGLLTLRSLSVTNDGPEGARVYVGPRSEFSVGTDASGNFVIQRGADPNTPAIFSISTDDEVHLRSRRTSVRNLNVLPSGNVVVNGVSQWRLLRSEDFATGGGVGWSRASVTQCAGITMLGGFCRFAKGEVKKTFANLPMHGQVRIMATYHFIDRWVGEAGYMKLNIGMSGEPVVVWSEQHSQEMSVHGISICGQGTPEGKFAVPIDITMPHTQAALEVTFGSTMDDMDPCDESWGVSGVELYIRN